MNLTYAQLIGGNRNFRNLLWGQFISELGNWFNFVAGLGIVRLVSGESPVAAGMLLFWRTLPFALLMPFAGTLADRLSRKNILIISDVLRGFFALIFLLVTEPSDLWIAYVASVLVSGTSAFFDGAKNAATPNIAGSEGLLSGTSLMLSTRFLLMAVGAALGGVATVLFGYKVAFIINSISFFISAYSIWLIPEDAMREKTPLERRIETVQTAATSFFEEIKEGFQYTLKNPFALTILLMNVIWALGGGMTNIVFEGLSVNVFSDERMNADFVYSVLLTANGLGLFFGMVIAHRVGNYVERKGITRSFMGWALIFHGVLFAVGGFMPSLWLVCGFIIFSRVLIGAEYAVQETMFQRSLPDRIRGRISTLDRGAEILMYSIASFLAGVSLTIISAQTATAIAGLLAGCSGVVWLIRTRKAKNFGQNEEDVQSFSKLENHKSQF
ncbi:MAG: MFS transporter [Acidobacteriota bacterium]|nr:MFS transporter [Acidobacteriota bacterium]